MCRRRDSNAFGAWAVKTCAMPRYHDIEDLRRAARRRLPSFVCGYVEGGGFEEETLRKNRDDIRQVSMVPRALNDVAHRNLKKQILGEESSMPLILAPVGAAGFTHPNGEVEAARAAHKRGIPFCLSTLSINTIEDVAEAIKAPFWFQLYFWLDRGVVKGLIERAKAANCSTLILSLDCHVRSQRHREQRGGLTAPLIPTIPMAFDALCHPRWLFPMLTSKRWTFGNLEGLVPHARNVPKISEWIEEQFDPTIGPKHIEYLREVWPGKLLVKGLMHPQDARQAISAGADGVILSNHGGRQVDGVTSTISMIGPVVDAVGGRGQVFVDGGIRSGIDLLKMLAFGADACLIGRAYIYGLAAAGEKGVDRAIGIIEKELDQTLGLCGITDVNEIPRDLLFERVVGQKSIFLI